MIDLIGFIAASLTTLSFLPQAIKTISSRDVTGISTVMYVLFTAGVAFWLLYGILIGNCVIIVANFITLILAGTVLVIKLKQDSKSF
jgi:MtN3 and saliva related transmembrane protein